MKEEKLEFLTTKTKKLLRKILKLEESFELEPKAVSQLTYDYVLKTKGVGKYTIRNIQYWLSFHGQELRNVPKESSAIKNAMQFLEANGYKITKPQ